MNTIDYGYAVAFLLGVVSGILLLDLLYYLTFFP